MVRPSMSPAADRNIRGRTAPARLRALDVYLHHSERSLLERNDGAFRDAAFIDFGFGEHPWTTLESASLFRQVNPELCVVGVEREPHRVDGARGHADARTVFRLGGFDSLIDLGGAARLVRAMNVLRGYAPDEVPLLHERLGAPLITGGLLIDGTSDETGALVTAHLLRKTGSGLMREALLFSTDFTRGFAPIQFRDWLPKDLRRSVKPGSAIHAFFARWTGAWKEARAAGQDAPARAFAESAAGLRAQGEPIRDDRWLEQNGFLVWAPEGGVPRSR